MHVATVCTFLILCWPGDLLIGWLTVPAGAAALMSADGMDVLAEKLQIFRDEPVRVSPERMPVPPLQS
jgi:hypothetical protein